MVVQHWGEKMSGDAIPTDQQVRKRLIDDIKDDAEEFWKWGKINHKLFISASILIAICSIILSVLSIGDFSELLGTNWRKGMVAR
jgi:hypothetical protein